MRFARPASDTTHLYLTPFLVTFSTLMLFGLHGSSALKVLGLLAANYAVAKAGAGRKVAPLLTWVFNMLVLFANERNSGYRFAALHPALASLVRFSPPIIYSDG